MSKQIARKLDGTTGVCAEHGPQTGEIKIVAATKTYCENELVAVVGDTVEAACGHTGIIDSNTSTVLCENGQVARVGDTFSGTYTGIITEGASKTFEGGAE